MKTNFLVFTSAAALSIFLTGCTSTLEVKIDVLDQNTLRNSIRQNQQADLLFAEDARLESAKELATLKAEIFSNLQANYPLGKLYTAEVKELPKDISGIIDKKYTDYKLAVKAAVNKNIKAKTVDEKNAALDAFLTARYSFNELSEDIINHIKALIEAKGEKNRASGKSDLSDQSLPAIPNDLTLTSRDLYNELRGAYELSEVVGAPESAWKGTLDNAKAFTFFGNSDIAIKALDSSSSNFSLKGVKLDSSQAINATMTATRAAVQTIASAYGVSLPQGAQGIANPGDTNTPISAITLKSNATNQINQAKLDRILLLEAFLARENSLISNDDHKVAIEQLNSLDVLK